MTYEQYLKQKEERIARHINGLLEVEEVREFCDLPEDATQETKSQAVYQWFQTFVANRDEKWLASLGLREPISEVKVCNERGGESG